MSQDSAMLDIHRRYQKANVKANTDDTHTCFVYHTWDQHAHDVSISCLQRVEKPSEKEQQQSSSPITTLLPSFGTHRPPLSSPQLNPTSDGLPQSAKAADSVQLCDPVTSVPGALATTITSPIPTVLDSCASPPLTMQQPAPMGQDSSQAPGYVLTDPVATSFQTDASWLPNYGFQTSSMATNTGDGYSQFSVGYPGGFNTLYPMATQGGSVFVHDPTMHWMPPYGPVSLIWSSGMDGAPLPGGSIIPSAPTPSIIASGATAVAPATSGTFDQGTGQAMQNEKSSLADEPDSDDWPDGYVKREQLLADSDGTDKFKRTNAVPVASSFVPKLNARPRGNSSLMVAPTPSVGKVWEHVGHHPHPHPPGGPLSQREERALDEQVARRPKASAHVLRTGSTVLGSIAIGKISPTLYNSRTARYQVQKSQARVGIQPSGSSKNSLAVAAQLAALNKKLDGFIIDSQVHGPSFIMMQSAAMKWPNTGRHGFITDGDHSFFQSGTLLTTVAFSPVLKQWVPVFDFSLAQCTGHAEAFADCMINGFGTTQWASLTSEAQSSQRQKYLKQAADYQKGCVVHFHRSETRVKQDPSLVPPDKRDDFQASINVFLSPDTERTEFDDAVSEFNNTFPQLRNWLRWWLQKKIAPMIFPAYRTMSSIVANALPKTSNPVETQHSLLHHATGTHREPVKGIEEISLHVEELYGQYKAIKAGHFAPSNRIEKTRSHPQPKGDYINDGRAPDTAAALQTGKRLPIGTSSKPLIPADSVVCPSGTFDLLKRESIRHLHSYLQYHNSCFVDCGLELLFRAYVLWPLDLRREVFAMSFSQGSVLQRLLQRFHERFNWIVQPYAENKTQPELSKKSKLFPTMQLDDNPTKGTQLLNATQATARHAVYVTWKLYPVDSYGDIVHWLEKLFAEESGVADVLSIFGFEHHVVRQCIHGHCTIVEQSTPVSLLTLTQADVQQTLHAIGEPKQLDLGAYLSYFTPRFSDSKDCIGQHRGANLLTLPPKPCHNAECSSASSVKHICTSWPQTLLIIPESRSDSEEAFERRELPLVKLPLEFEIQSIGSTTRSSKTISSEAGSSLDPVKVPNINADPVRYRLIGRILYNASEVQSHYTAELVISDEAYKYNNLEDNGMLSEIGAAGDIASIPDRHVSLVAYHRISKSKMTYRAASDLAPELSSNKVTSGALKKGGKCRSQAKKKKSDPTMVHTPCTPPLKAPLSDTQSSDSVILCAGCGETTEDDGIELIKCDICQKWSHVPCIAEQFGLSKSYHESSWFCADCSSVPLWTDTLIGQSIYYCTHPKSKRMYAARITQRDGAYAIVEWYRENAYVTQQEILKSTRIPIHRCALAAIRLQRKHRHTSDDKVQLGKLKWPLRLHEDAIDRGYLNSAITNALQDSLNSVVQILTGNRPHAIMDRYRRDVGSKVERPETASTWHARYAVPILHGDASLIHPLLTDLQHRLTVMHTAEEWHPSVNNMLISNLVFGPGLMLFHLVILRIYLGRQAEDDDEIYCLVVNAVDEADRLKANIKTDKSPSHSKTSQSESPHSPIEFDLSSLGSFSLGDSDDSSMHGEPFATTRIIRRLTLPEQALAA
ncbi:hypothetical protein NM688_g1521 [Phlebia brevispora]|uniref:Uncharacterized protein n=1 Tax=Phlebia brevispora TaxID=194682 RepID=A0ACC1TB38_9APHY|nr:hypothetical protein NM688_g1521 [Phlebia brevispora]